MRVLIAVLLLACAGCGITSAPPMNVAYTALPIIEKPNRPPLVRFTEPQLTEYYALSTETRTVIEGNMTEMRIYAVKLEASIEAYNLLARQVNESHERTMKGLMGVKSEPASPDN